MCAVLCVAADNKDKEAIEGWKVMHGNWECSDKLLRSSGGTIVTTKEAKRSLLFSATVRVAEFPAGKCFGLFWGWSASEEGYNERNQLIIYADSISLSDSRQKGGSAKVKFDWPVGKPVKIKGKITPTGAVFQIGTIRITPKTPLDGLQNFALHTNGPDVSFSSVAVKAR